MCFQINRLKNDVASGGEWKKKYDEFIDNQKKEAEKQEKRHQEEIKRMKEEKEEAKKNLKRLEDAQKGTGLFQFT